ncbi:MAG: aquaporin [Candidatus Cloacimonadota bacterium]|nr:aquaporin [Candidatus Cloacimonadota bacterium]
MENRSLWSRFTAEFIGTFFLVFAGTGSIIVNSFYNGIIGHVGISITFGLVVMTMIYAIGDLSGAHLNPAVSFGFWVSKKISHKVLIYYTVSQILGAFSASLILFFSFPDSATYGETLPQLGIIKTAVFEIILSFFLMFVILHVSTGSKEKGLLAGVAVGGTVMLEALFAGPLTGASMNPARSLAPAIISNNLDTVWIYITAPMIGAMLAVLSCKLLREECCMNQDKSSHVTQFENNSN